VCVCGLPPPPGGAGPMSFSGRSSLGGGGGGYGAMRLCLRMFCRYRLAVRPNGGYYRCPTCDCACGCTAANPGSLYEPGAALFLFLGRVSFFPWPMSPPSLAGYVFFCGRFIAGFVFFPGRFVAGFLTLFGRFVAGFLTLFGRFVAGFLTLLGRFVAGFLTLLGRLLAGCRPAACVLI